MPRFNITVSGCYDFTRTVEAATEEEAEQLGHDLSQSELPNGWSTDCDDVCAEQIDEN